MLKARGTNARCKVLDYSRDVAAGVSLHRAGTVNMGGNGHISARRGRGGLLGISSTWSSRDTKGRRNNTLGVVSAGETKEKRWVKEKFGEHGDLDCTSRRASYKVC